MVPEVALHHCLEPAPLLGNRVIAASAQLLLDLLELRSHPVGARVALQLEAAAPLASADEGEPQEVEGLRLALPAPLSPLGREAAELQQPGLALVQLQPEVLHPLLHRVPETLRIGLQLESDHYVVGVPHDDHLSHGFALSP